MAVNLGDGSHVNDGAAEESWGGEDDDGQNAETGWFYEEEAGGKQSIHAGKHAGTCR